jgi:hypothetical protein
VQLDQRSGIEFLSSTFIVAFIIIIFIVILSYVERLNITLPRGKFHLTKLLTNIILPKFACASLPFGVLFRKRLTMTGRSLPSKKIIFIYEYDSVDISIYLATASFPLGFIKPPSTKSCAPVCCSISLKKVLTSVASNFSALLHKGVYWFEFLHL